MPVLIHHGYGGRGSLASSPAALEEAWRERRPEDAVRKVDLLELVPPSQRSVYVRGQTALAQHAAGLWGMVFKRTDDPVLMGKLTKLRRAFIRHTNRKFIAQIKAFRPDVVLCTHYLPVEIMGLLKANGFKPFTVCVTTDFEAHALWLDSTTDLYSVAAAETKASLTTRGIARNRILVTGIPISLRFAKLLEPREVCKTLGLRDDLPVALVLGGGSGLVPMAEVLNATEDIGRQLQIVVVAGRTYRRPTRVFGFVGNMNELMAVSDLIVTKSGGLTALEALAPGKPLLILDPISGQEAANRDFLLERGAAAKVNRVDDLLFRVGRLLG